MSSEPVAAAALLGDRVPLSRSGRDSEQVLLGHGSGGRLTAELIEQIILPAFAQPGPRAARRSGDAGRAAAASAWPSPPTRYVVTPLFFPGGDIGSLAVHGTVNDLAMGGRPAARPVAGLHPRGGAAAGGAAPGDRLGAGGRRRGGRAHRHRRHQGGGARLRRSALHQHLGRRAGPGRASTSPRARIAPGDAVLRLGHARRSRGGHPLAARGAGPGGRDRQRHARRCTSWPPPCCDACPDTHALRDPTRGGPGRDPGRDRRAPAAGHRRSTRARCPVQRRGARRLRAVRPRSAAGGQRGQAGGLRARRPRRGRAWPPCAPIRWAATPALIGQVTAEHAGLVVLRTPIGGQRILDLPLSRAASAHLLSDQPVAEGGSERHGEATSSGVEEVHILWISEGMSCDGDTVSVTAATQPSIEDVVLGLIPGSAQGPPAQQGAGLRDRRGLPGAVPAGGPRRAGRRTCW